MRKKNPLNLILRNLQVMIVSYETFRLHADKFQSPGSCDLLICDEAHRLKNDQTLTNKASAVPYHELSYLDSNCDHLQEIFDLKFGSNESVQSLAMSFFRAGRVTVDLDMFLLSN